MKNPIEDQVRLFGMRNLMLESDLLRLEKEGIDIQHAGSIRKDDLVDIDLFERDIMSDARRMADFYVLYFALENTIRRLISQRLQERHGASWWDTKVPKGVRDSVAEKQQREKESVAVPVFWTVRRLNHAA